MMAHKSSYPSLKVLLAVGGWNFGTYKMTAMLATKVSKNPIKHPQGLNVRFLVTINRFLHIAGEP